MFACGCVDSAAGALAYPGDTSGYAFHLLGYVILCSPLNPHENHGADRRPVFKPPLAH